MNVKSVISNVVSVMRTMIIKIVIAQ